MTGTITVTFSAYAFGALRGLIQREIDNVERHQRVVGVRCAPTERELADAYLRQLRESLAAVEAVYDELGAT